MEELTIVPVSGKRMLRQFVRFPLKLYKNCDKWVPAFEDDEYKSLGPENPSLTFCERELNLAFRGKRVVGRIAAILNRKANQKWGEELVRELGIDSLTMLLLSLAAEEKFGMHFPDGAPAPVTVGEVCDAVVKARA